MVDMVMVTLWKGIKMYVRDNKSSHRLLSWSPLRAVEQKYITGVCSTENTLQKKIYIYYIATSHYH